MAEDKEGSGFLGQIRRMSRRLSGTLLKADERDVKAYLIRNDKRLIYSYEEDQMVIGKYSKSVCNLIYFYAINFPLTIGGVVVKELAEEYGKWYSGLENLK